MEKSDNVEHPVWMDAIYDRWGNYCNKIAGLLLLSALIALFCGYDAEWMLWIGVGFALGSVARFIWLARAIRKGDAQPPQKSSRQRLLSAWMSVVWFLLFGIVGLFLTVGAPGYIRAVLWTMVGVVVAAGAYLLFRKHEKTQS